MIMMTASEMGITYHSLQIHLWIPIRVIYDDNICCGKVNTKTTSSRWQHKDEFLTAWRIEFIDLSLTVLMRCLSIQSTVLKNVNQLISSAKDMLNILNILWSQ